MQKLEQQNATTNPMHAANSHPYNNTIPSPPGAQAREPIATFNGHPVNVCNVREPAVNLSLNAFKYTSK